MTHVGISVVVALFAAAAVRAAPAATAPVDVERLRVAAGSADPGVAMGAVRQLAASGAAGRAVAREVLPKLMERDAGVIRAESNSTAPTAVVKLRAAEGEVGPLRAAMLKAAAGMTRDAGVLKGLRADYERLAAVQVRLAAGYGRQVRIAEAMGRREECLEIWRTEQGAGVGAIEAENRVMAKGAERVWEVPVETVMAWLGTGRAARAEGVMTPPENVAWRGVWFYSVCRRIEAYNRALESGLNAGEVAHLRKLNAYREMLGLWPYELDLRLTQAARRHSREMFDLRYFSHWSPTAGQENYFRRAVSAGYGRASSENITLGAWTGEDAFGFLFNSPSHHHAWLVARDSAVGVGKWENAWTESFGAGARLMLGSEEERAGAAIAGEVLGAQTVELTRKKPREMGEYKYYDPAGREVPFDGFRAGKP